jgi:hypothetical protein
MHRDSPQGPEHQVLPFRPRQPVISRSRPSRAQQSPPTLAKYEGSDAEDNYRHRMLVNVAGFAVTIALAIAGAWLAVHIADLRKNQDCALSGRRNCTPIDGTLLQRR